MPHFKADFRHCADIALGVMGVLIGIFSKEFRPSGWTTALMFGKGEKARIPRAAAALFYMLVGLALLYHGIYK